MIVFNFVLTCICFWMGWVVYHRYIRMSHVNKVRFRLYGLRDEVALLGMKGIVDPEGPQYKAFVQMLNNSIRVMTDFEVINFMRLCVAYSKDETMRKRVSLILDKVQEGDDCYRKIVCEYFALMQKELTKNTRVFRCLSTPTKHLLQIIVRYIGFLKFLMTVFREREDALRAANSGLARAIEMTSCEAAA